MKIPGTKRADVPTPQTLYATGEDLCRIFEGDMDRLYRLSLLLTADFDLAEKCFVRGLEDSKGSNPVFKEWAESWARRTIIINAIRMIGPRPEILSVGRPRDVKGLPPELAVVLSLKPFDRFVFVMSLLEGCPERDLRLLLDCSNSDIARARARALKGLSLLAEQRGTSENTIELQSKVDDCELTIAPETAPRLAVSA